MTAVQDRTDVTTLTFDAGTLARGWLSVALASVKGGSPILDRTICVEVFPTGVRLVATDRYVLLRTWVPASSEDHVPSEPEADEVPTAEAVAIDRDGRARGLLGWLLSLTDDEDQPMVFVELSVFEDEDPDVPALDGMSRRRLSLHYPGKERVTLDVYDGEYPPWRSLLTGFKAESAATIALTPEIVARLAKLGKIHPLGLLLWHFGGSDKMALFEVRPSAPRVSGAVAPVRVDKP